MTSIPTQAPPARIKQDKGVTHLRTILASVEEVSRHYIGMRSTIAAQQKRNEDLEEVVKELRENNDELRASNLTRHRRVSDLERSVKVKEARLVTLREQVDLLEDKLAAYERTGLTPRQLEFCGSVFGDMLNKDTDDHLDLAAKMPRYQLPDEHPALSPQQPTPVAAANRETLGEGEFYVLEDKTMARWQRLATAIYNRVRDGHNKLALIMAELLADEIKEEREYDVDGGDVAGTSTVRRERTSEDNEGTGQADMFD